ncbi:MAG TPA: DivIVA domain-containing protein [Actinomycetota bacterium]|nr:DivIVA domain-containing protein [Actinomycetota bacterium]
MNAATPDTMRSPWATMHPAEIAAHEFPRTRKGYDPDAVRAWLRAVAAAVDTLQGELAHVRAERDRLESVLRRAGEDPPASAVRTALMQARLRRRPGGYDRAEVEALLEAAASEIARLETRSAVLEAEAARSRDAALREAALTDAVAQLQAEITSIRSRLPSVTSPAPGSLNGIGPLL